MCVVNVKVWVKWVVTHEARKAEVVVGIIVIVTTKFYK